MGTLLNFLALSQNDHICLVIMIKHLLCSLKSKLYGFPHDDRALLQSYFDLWLTAILSTDCLELASTKTFYFDYIHTLAHTYVVKHKY